MSFLSFLLGEKKKTASVAKERLQIILAHERISLGGKRPDYLPELQRELVAVISKYVSINAEDIKVHLEKQDDLEVLDSRRSSCPTAPALARALSGAASRVTAARGHEARHLPQHRGVSSQDAAVAQFLRRDEPRARDGVAVGLAIGEAVDRDRRGHAPPAWAARCAGRRRQAPAAASGCPRAPRSRCCMASARALAEPEHMREVAREFTR